MFEFAAPKFMSNGARPDLRVCFHFVDHRSAKFYGNLEITYLQNNKQNKFLKIYWDDFLIAIKKTWSHLLTGGRPNKWDESE